MKMKSDFETDENEGIIFKISKNNHNKLPRQSLSNITNQINNIEQQSLIPFSIEKFKFEENDFNQINMELESFNNSTINNDFFETGNEFPNKLENKSKLFFQKTNRSNNDVSKTCRFKKNKNQIEILKVHFEKNKVWTKNIISMLSKLTSLKHTQVYKWYWDQKLKFKKKDKIKNEEKSHNNNFKKIENEEIWVATKIRLSEKSKKNKRLIEFLSNNKEPFFLTE